MPTTLNIIANSRTPYSVVLSIENLNGAENPPPLPNLSRATLIAAANQANALADGSLKELIRRTPDLRVLNQTGPSGKWDDFVRFTTLLGGLNQTLTPANNTCVLNFILDALEASIASENEGPVAAHILVEMRLVHSNER
jgi:hypothetical protein